MYLYFPDTPRNSLIISLHILGLHVFIIAYMFRFFLKLYQGEERHKNYTKYLYMSFLNKQLVRIYYIFDSLSSDQCFTVQISQTQATEAVQQNCSHLYVTSTKDSWNFFELFIGIRLFYVQELLLCLN
jgi:ammonia channel protein AmtB